MTVDNTPIIYEYNNEPIVIKIINDAPYTIKFGSLDGFYTPIDSNKYTAYKGNVRNLEYIYEEIQTGVFIMDLSGKLHHTSLWTGGSDCTGVAVVNANTSIVISPTFWYSHSYCPAECNWNGNRHAAWGKQVSVGIDSTWSEEGKNGSNNTDLMISKLAGLQGNPFNGVVPFTGSPAAEYCRAYSRGCKGIGEWHLPSYFEYEQIVANISSVDNAFDKIGYERIGDPHLKYNGARELTLQYNNEWTSNEYSYDSSNAYLYNWNEKKFRTYNKETGYEVRPVCYV